MNTASATVGQPSMIVPPPGGEGVVLSVKNLVKHFDLKKSMFALSGLSLTVKAVDDVSFDIHVGEVLGLVGESGCGKTTTGRLITRLENPTRGRIDFLGRDIANLKGSEMVAFRRYIQMIFQDPYESLNPRFTVYRAVADPLNVLGIGEKEERVDLVVDALEEAGLRPATELLGRFPHELSGGQRQRVAIARALVVKPRFIVADEPVSMLDVSIRAGVMNLMLELRDKYDIPFLFITHDISVARYMSDNIGVMYLGRLSESGPTEEVITHPAHPYTRALLAAVPVPDPDHEYPPIPILGELPSPINIPKGCRFHTRCVFATQLCREIEPWHIEVSPGHTALCHFATDFYSMGPYRPPPEPLKREG